MAITIQMKPLSETQCGAGLQDKSLANGGKSVFAGNLGIGAKNEETAGLIAQKKSQAKKQAMKIVSDAWENDKKSLQGIDDMNAAKEEKKAELYEHNARLKDIAEQNEALRKMPETEAVKAALAQNAEEAGQISSMAREAEQQVIGLTQSVTSTRIDRLKSQEMLKAQDAAEKIKEAAGEEIVGLLVKDGVEHIKEELEEKLEKAEEAQEKKEEEQDTPAMMEEVKRSIQKIMIENHMVEEDLKGIEIDLNY